MRLTGHGPSLLAAFIGLLFPMMAALAAPIEGRYVYYGNGLSSVIGLAELEVWSGDTNLLAGKTDCFTIHCLMDESRMNSLPTYLRNLTDGNTNTLDKWPKTCELASRGGSSYSDTSLSLCAFEADLGASVPIDRIEVYRSRIRLENGQPWKLPGDLGWRYVLILDEQRRIVSWDVFNAYEDGWLDVKKGHWTIVPTPAQGAPAGKVVPLDRHNWLSEAEFIRDFLAKPVEDLNSSQSEADRARLERFSHRDDPDAIRELGKAFFFRVDLDRPELSEVKRLVEKEQYAEALEAFKAPFFKTIEALDLWYGKFEYYWEYVPDSRIELRARDLTNHIYADKKALTVKRFTPGLLPPARLEKPSQTQPLLLTYAGTGDKQYLRAWESMTDDWAMGFQEAADRDPRIRGYFVLSGSVVTANLLDLLMASRDNDRFIADLSGATLARYLMPIVDEIPVSIWRVCRTCVYNHTFNATPGMWALAAVLPDFYAGQRLQLEAQQGLLRLYTKNQYRDGPMVEIGDEGHFGAQFGSPAHLYGLMCAEPSPWLTPAREAYFLDNLRQGELQAVRHTAPSGVGIRWCTRKDMIYPAMGGRNNDDPGDTVANVAAYLQKLSVMLEPESRAAIQTVYGPPVVQGERPTHLESALLARQLRPPTVVSDWLPYAGCWYFRGGWNRDDSFLHMLKPTIANNYGGGFSNNYVRGWERFNPTSFRFTDYATPLVTVFGTEIDKQRPCDKYGRYPSGSKQEAFSRAVEKPQEMRWFTDDRFDFGEAQFDGVYHNIYRYRHPEFEGTPEEVTYEDDPLTIEGASATRQIIQVRPARLFLQIERVHYATPDETHTLRFPLTFILTEPGEETGKAFSGDQLKIDEKRRTITTRNPGNPGVTAAWFGQEEMTFKPYSVNSSAINFWPQPDPETVDPEADAMLSADSWGKGWDTLNGLRRTSGRGVMASWPATGSSLVLASLAANAPDDEPVQRQEDISTDQFAGLRIRSRARFTQEKNVELRVARTIPATLEVGPISMEGEALLIVETPRFKTRSVMALGATRLSIAGKPVELPARDVVFDLSPDDEPSIVKGSLAPIRRPLDPPTIGPVANVFSGSAMVTLTSSSPDTVIRYTTEEPKSRLAEFRRAAEDVLAGRISATRAAERLALRKDEGRQWKEYTGPFEITEDTFVRARTFRKGVETVPMLEASGEDVSAMSYGFFTRTPMKEAHGGFFTRTRPGLDYDYLEGRWFELWDYADRLPAKASGTTQKLMDVSMRQTDGPFAVRYSGYLDVPAEGVYTFHAPNEYIDNSCAPGYDLRVFVDGEEWVLNETWHGRGTWSVPLEKGLHQFMVTFSDARARDLEHQRVDLAMNYPRPRTTWKGVAPVLEVSGPGIDRQPVPNGWLKHK